MYSDFHTMPQVLGHIVLRYVRASQTYLDLTATQSCKQEADKQAALSQAENQGPCLWIASAAETEADMRPPAY